MVDGEYSLPIPSATSLCEGLGHWGQEDRADGGVIKLSYMPQKSVMT